jgi:hypothetical protein
MFPPIRMKLKAPISCISLKKVLTGWYPRSVYRRPTPACIVLLSISIRNFTPAHVGRHYHGSGVSSLGFLINNTGRIPGTDIRINAKIFSTVHLTSAKHKGTDASPIASLPAFPAALLVNFRNKHHRHNVGRLTHWKSFERQEHSNEALKAGFLERPDCN